MDHQTFDTAIALELLELGTATIGEASTVPCVCCPELKPAWSGVKMCGRAYTVRCHPGDNLAIHHALERAQEGDVLVVDAGGVSAGYWGEVLSIAAQTKGVKGLVIDGGVRDVEAMERLQFPVFSKNIALAGTVKHEQGELQVPLCIAGAPVQSGDIVLADRDGIVFLPFPELEPTLAAARYRDEKEKAVMQELRNGKTTVDIFNLKMRK